MLRCQAYTLFQSILQGHTPNSKDIDSLLPQHPEEGLHLEFKDGKLLNKKKKERNAELRHHVSGFANSEGGLLVIGVEERREKNKPVHRSVSPCNSGSVGGDLAGWATRTLGQQIGAHLVPSPRIHVVQHSEGAVLILAIPRTDRLIPCWSEGGPTYSFRLGDGTYTMPEYLYADLTLGRRQRAELRPKANGTLLSQVPEWNLFSLQLVLENVSPIWVERVRVEMFGYVASSAWHVPAHSSRTSRRIAKEVPKSALRYFDVEQLHELNSGVARLAGINASKQTNIVLGYGERIAPFTDRDFSMQIEMPTQMKHIKWEAALLVSVQGATPEWHQYSVTIDNDTRNTKDEVISQCDGFRRPRVFYGSLDEYIERGLE